MRHRRLALRLRMLVALGLVFALPVFFLSAALRVVNLLVVPIAPGGPYYGELYLHPALGAGAVALFLCLQAWFGPRSVRSSVGAHLVDESDYPGVHATVGRLAQQADLEPPAVAVLPNAAPNSMAVSGPGEAAVVVTTGLLETLDDRETEAVLAHEVAHLKNRDATVMTVAWFLPAVTYHLARGTASLFSGLRSEPLETVRLWMALLYVFPVLLVSAATLVVSSVFWLGSVFVHRVLARSREYATDRGAAALTGDPAALAAALRAMSEALPAAPDEDLRALDGGTEALCAVPLDGAAFSGEGLVSADVFPATHPSTEDRIERLREMTGDLA